MKNENAKLTGKQSAFVMRYAECGNASEAYRQAYNAENMSTKSIQVEACRLLANPNVSLTVEHIKAEARERSLITIEGQTARLQSLSVKAELMNSESGINAAISAEKEINKLHGLIVDKKALTALEGSTTPLPWVAMYRLPDNARDPVPPSQRVGKGWNE